MAKLSEGYARIKTEIDSGRHSRAELAAEIKNATISRHNDVEALLDNLKVARMRSGRDLAAQLRRATMTRNDEVRATLIGLKSNRARDNKAYHEKADAFMRDLTNGVAALLASFANDNQDRASALHRSFAEYARDRKHAAAIWQGKASTRH